MAGGAVNVNERGCEGSGTGRLKKTKGKLIPGVRARRVSSLTLFKESAYPDKLSEFS
jgi:hypothetical protein